MPCGCWRMPVPAGKQPKVMVVGGAEGGRMESACDHRQRLISELPCLAEPAGIHQQQRDIPGSHKSGSNSGLQYGSNWHCLNICLSHMNCTGMIPLFSLYPADVLFRFANVVQQILNKTTGGELLNFQGPFSAITINTFSPCWLMAQDWNQISFLLLLFL